MKIFFLEKQKAALIPLLLSITMPLRNIFITSIWTFRSSHPEVFLKKGVLKMCIKFTGEQLLCNFIEITLRQRCSPANLLHIFRTSFIKNTHGRLLLRIVVDPKLYFKFRFDQKTKKCNKLIGLIRRLSINVPRNALLTIYKLFIRPHLDYGDILYDKPENENVLNKLEKVQYRACLAITSAIQETSRQKLYDELGLHSLSKRRWRNKLIFLYKILSGLLRKYLYSYLTFPYQKNYPLRSALTNKTNVIPLRTKSFKKTFFPNCINEWNNLNAEIRNAKSTKFFKKMIVTENKENFFFFMIPMV